MIPGGDEPVWWLDFEARKQKIVSESKHDIQARSLERRVERKEWLAAEAMKEVGLLSG